MDCRFPVREIGFSLLLQFISKMVERRLAGRQTRRKEDLEITSNTNLIKIVSIKEKNQDGPLGPALALWKT